MKKRMLLLFSIVFLLGCLASCSNSPVPSIPANTDFTPATVPEETLSPNVSENYKTRVDFGAKFEPKGNYILHGAGQYDTTLKNQDFELYLSVVGEERMPAITMAYASAPYKPHHEEMLRDMVDDYEDEWLIYQIGSYFGHDGSPELAYYDEIAEGKWDDDLRKLINMFKETGHPIFCRAGYEFNGEWNGYTDPEIYKKAFIRFAQIVEECNADNVALVWCYNPDAADREYMKYYPGDEYVDWWAIDIFRIGTIDLECTKNFLREAEFHEKPVMIGETTCFNYYVDEGADAWEGWYEKYFQFIRNNPVIKATCYINRDWEIYPLWQGWGDSRLEVATNGLAEKYMAELSDPIYLHAMDKETAIKMLYDCADYEQ